MNNTIKYTVCFIFNNDGTKVLLQLKRKTAYKGKLNGIGGKFEQGEGGLTCAFRKLEEETNLILKDLNKFEWIGTLITPEQCDTDNSDYLPELYFYAAAVKDESLAHKPNEDAEDILWFNIVDDKVDTGEYKLAGDGDVEYMIKKGITALFKERTI